MPVIRLAAVLPLLLLQPLLLSAQKPTPAHYVRLMLGKAELQSKEFPTNLAERTERQLMQILAEDGGKPEERYSAYVVLPSVQLIEKAQIDTPVVRQTVRVHLQLQLAQVFSREVLLIRSVPLTGSGSTVQEAIVRAMSGIRNSNGALVKAVEEFRLAAAAHLEKTCGDLRKTAQDSAGRQNYLAALALLHAIPSGTVCYGTVQEAKNLYFSNLLNANCEDLLRATREALAGEELAAALSNLSQLTADSPCHSEAKALAATLEKSTLEAGTKERHQWMFNFFRQGEGVDRAKWNAMNAWAMGYLRKSGPYPLVSP